MRKNKTKEQLGEFFVVCCFKGKYAYKSFTFTTFKKTINNIDSFLSLKFLSFNEQFV